MGYVFHRINANKDFFSEEKVVKERKVPKDKRDPEETKRLRRLRQSTPEYRAKAKEYREKYNADPEKRERLLNQKREWNKLHSERNSKEKKH